MNSGFNSNLNSVIFAGVLYVNSIWMLCNDYYTNIPFETSILYRIILHTCVLFKIANKHEFISSFSFSYESILFGMINVDTFNSR